MSISVNATFNLPLDTFQSLIPFINQVVIEYTEKEERLRIYLINMYLHCYKNKVDKLILQSLWKCINSPQIYNDCLTFFQTYNSDVIVNYLKSKNEKIFASILEDDDFYTKLMDYIIDDDNDDNMEEVNQKEVDDIINNYKPSLGVLDMLGDDKFNEFLVKMGINEEGRKKAKHIKDEMKTTGKPDMNKVMAFIQEYKQNFDSSNVDLNTLYSMMTGADLSDKEKPQLPFDLNSMMGIINTLSSSMSQNKSRRGRRR